VLAMKGYRVLDAERLPEAETRGMSSAVSNTSNNRTLAVPPVLQCDRKL
jgi:hypothetical protein